MRRTAPDFIGSTSVSRCRLSRIRAVEVSFGGKPAANFHALLAACCTDAGSAPLPKTSLYYSGDLRGRMLQAGKSVRLFSWPEAADDPRWARLGACRGMPGSGGNLHQRVAAVCATEAELAPSLVDYQRHGIG
jgi:hypothetical protein